MEGPGPADEVADWWRDEFMHADQLAVVASAGERSRRGQAFERILRGMLTEAGLAPRIRFRPRGEEIDGSFFHRDRVLLLEAKWTRDSLPASSIYEFRGKVEGKLVGTIGVFISMGGFSRDAVNALVAGKTINTILFDGDDIRAIAAGQVSFPAALDQKLRAAAETGTPYLPLRDPVSRRPLDLARPARDTGLTATVIVEGLSDARLIHLIADALRPPGRQLEVVPAGGAFNLAAVANTVYNAAGDSPVIIIADGDGQPEAIRRHIAASLDTLTPGASTQIQIHILDPELEEALGFAEGTPAPPQRGSLRDGASAADIRQLARDNPQLQALLRALGLGQ